MKNCKKAISAFLADVMAMGMMLGSGKKKSGFDEIGKNDYCMDSTDIGSVRG